MKTILIFLVALISNNLIAQIDAGLLIEITKATTAEINAVVSPTKGVLIYNTDEDKVFYYDGTNWAPMAEKFIDGVNANDAVYSAGKVGIGTNNPSTKLEVDGGPIKATGGLIIETRTSDPTSPEDGRLWLRTDL